MMFERELTVLDGNEPGSRISVVELSAPDVDAVVELRFEQEVSGLGWVTQRRIAIPGRDIKDLRLALTLFAASNTAKPVTPRVIALADYDNKKIA